MQTGKTFLVLGIATLSMAVGCNRNEVKVYRVAKEDKPALPAAPAAAGHGPAGALPHIHGDAPASWIEQPPQQMRAASFQIRGDGARLAQIAIIPMPGARGIELQSINLWREELGMEPLTADQYEKEAKAIKVGDEQGHFFEMAARAPRSGEDFNRSTLGAVFEREGMLWFAKLTGEGTLVSEQKENFQKYLASLDFHSGSHGSTSAPPRSPGFSRGSEQAVSANSGPPPSGSGIPKWNPPLNWKEKIPGPMLTAAFTVEGGPGTADVTISKLEGEGGGVVANVNRWRGQLGLAAGSDADIKNSVTMLEVDGKKDSYLADLAGTNVRTGKPARMLAAGVSKGGETWFYKLMGDESVVSQEKDAFLKFVRSTY